MTPVARMIATFMLIIVLAGAAAGVGGYNVIVQSREQSRYNASLLRIIVALSGCTPADTPAACVEIQRVRGEAEGKGRVLEVECRIRLAIARLPAPPPTGPCVLPADLGGTP